MKKIILMIGILFLYGLINPCRAQSMLTVKGAIVDASGNPVEGAIINFLTAGTKALLKSSISESNGTFSLICETHSDFLISISALNFYRLDTIVSTLGSSTLNLPSFTLKPSAKELQEVTIRATVPFIEIKPDKVVINPDAQISTAGSNAYDLLSKSPGVIVNQNGEIKLKGKAGVVVYIDDKPTYLTGTELESFLKSIPSSSIKQIELITNPPARYEAAGSAGIIHFKTKRNKLKGWNGLLSVSYGQGRYARTNNNLNLNYSNSKISFFSSLGASANNHYQDLNIRRVYKDQDNSVSSVFNQRTYIRVNSRAYNAKAGLDWYVNSKTTVGVAGRFLKSPSAVKRYNYASILEPDGVTNSYVIADNSDKTVLKNTTLNANVRHQFDSTGTSLTADLDFVNYQPNLEQKFRNEVVLPSGSITYSDTQTGSLPSGINIYAAKSDFSKVLKNQFTFETGIKSSYTKTDNNAQYTITRNDTTRINYNLSNRFLYDEFINAAYVNYSGSFQKLDLQTGLRFESTQLFANQVGNNEREASSFNRTYNNLFPTLYLTYKLDSASNHILTAHYGKRIDRPYYKDLNPFVSPLDKYTYYSGNPYLKPSITHKLSLSYSFKNLLSVEISYNQVLNQTSETIEINKGIYYSRPGNIGSTKQYNLSLQNYIPVKKWLNISLYSELNYSEYKSQLYTEPLNSRGTYFYFNANNSFQLPKGFSAELSGEYLSTMVETQFVIGDFGHFTVGLQKKLFKDKGTLKFSLSDVLHSNRIRGTINNLASTEANWYSMRDTRVATTTFTYRFGTNKSKHNRYNSTGSENEQKRLKS